MQLNTVTQQTTSKKENLNAKIPSKSIMIELHRSMAN